MPNQTRQMDITIGFGTHGKNCCPHSIVGFIITGSPNVYTNGIMSGRTTDLGIHTCPHCGINIMLGGSSNTFINNLSSHRIGDPVSEICGAGISITGSPNVIVN